MNDIGKYIIWTQINNFICDQNKVQLNRVHILWDVLYYAHMLLDKDGGHLEDCYCISMWCNNNRILDRYHSTSLGSSDISRKFEGIVCISMQNIIFWYEQVIPALPIPWYF